MEEEKSSILKITERVTDLIQKLAGPMAEEVGLILGDKVRVYRVDNWIKTVQKVERKLREAGLPPNAVSPRLLLPIIEGSSVENDDSLQELWAGLLASASQQKDSVSPSFVETLKQLTPAEARHLEQICKKLGDIREGCLAKEQSISPYMFTESGGDPAGVSLDTFERLGLIRMNFDVELQKPYLGRPPDSIEEAVDSISAEMRYQYVLTSYALKFLKACHGPIDDSDLAGGMPHETLTAGVREGLVSQIMASATRAELKARYLQALSVANKIADSASMMAFEAAKDKRIIEIK